MRTRLRSARIAAVLAFAATRGSAQQVRGTVVDAVGRRPVPGAVVSVLDSAGATLARTIADESGQYSVPLAESARRLRVIRIGFRPREMPVPVAVDGIARAEIALTMIPTFLEPARVNAKSCPRRSDAEQASGLWEQARAGLLTGVVAREQKPASLVRIAFRQEMKGTSDEVASQTIVVDSVDRSANSYRAPFDASAFLLHGFADDSSGHRYYSAPDGEVLLDPAFANGYCFRIASPERARPNQVGLAFGPADKRDGRADIDGVLWVDTVARALRDIEYRYVNANLFAERLNAGGSVSFREMPNGVAFVDRWRLRLPGTYADTSRIGGRPRTMVHTVVNASGGEVAHATWADGTHYDASLGALALQVITPSGAPAAGAVLQLASTSYVSVTDSTGTFRLRDLLPGPYQLVVREPRLAPLHIDSLPTSFTFTAIRDSVHRATITVPTLEDWVASLCHGPPKRGRVVTDRTMILSRVLDVLRRPVGGIDFTIEVPSPTERSGWTQIAHGRTEADGFIHLCTDIAEPGQLVAITLHKGREMIGRLEQNLADDRLTIISLIIKP